MGEAVSFFKAYDMRGTYGVDFDSALVRKIGKALPRVVPGERWLIGRDARLTSLELRDALVDGLLSAGVSVTDIGLCTTPMVYYFTAADGYDGSVMITASHNPPTDNGLKVSSKTALPVGYANGLSKVEEIISTLPDDTSEKRSLAPSTDCDWIERYLEFIRSFKCLENIANSNLKFAIDASCGMAALLVKKIFPNALIINDTIDGAFPAHSPNPLNPEARKQVSQLVREKGLDCAVIFDGDADRAMFIDENGEFVQPDYLVPVVAKSCMKAHGLTKADRPKVLHDVRTSRGAIEVINELGCQSVMVEVGHAFAKPKMRELGALCGGELAGHYYFSDFFGCDSGVLAAIHILSQIAEAKSRGETFSKMMSNISSRYANSGELNFKVEDKDAAIERVKKCALTLSEITKISEIDGIRIDMRDGWVNVRKSNTEPYLRLVVEALNKDMLANWITLLTAAVGV